MEEVSPMEQNVKVDKSKAIQESRRISGLGFDEKTPPGGSKVKRLPSYSQYGESVGSKTGKRPGTKKSTSSKRSKGSQGSKIAQQAKKKD